MSEENAENAAETGAAPVQTPARERPSAVLAGIQMPAHEVRRAIAHAVATGRLAGEEDGDAVFWLYSYAREEHLSYREIEQTMAAKITAKLAPGANTVYQIFHGSYGAQSWAPFVDVVRKFQSVIQEELKRKNIGFVETSTAKVIMKACLSAMNDGMPAFIYGASQIGKTTALLEFQRTHNHGRTKYLRLGSRWTKGRVVRELAVMLGNGIKATRMWALEDAIFGGLSKWNLLIVDEFHLALETTCDSHAKEIVEFLREIYDRTGCGLVLASTKVGLEGLEGGKNRMLFDQLRRRGVVKVVLPDVPRLADINAVARSFDLPIPSGKLLADIKILLKTRGLGVFIKYLQKAYADAKRNRQDLTWEHFESVNDGYAALADMKNEY